MPNGLITSPRLCTETNIVKANIRALLTTSQQQPSSTTAQVLDEKQRTLCELLERWATVGKISMSQAALIQHQCGYISQTTQQQAAVAASTAGTATATLPAGTTNHHVAHHPISAQQNGTSTPNPNKLPSHHQPQQQQQQQHHTNNAHAGHHQSNSHHQDRSSQQLAVNAVKKRRSGKNKIVTLLMKNAEGEYECVSHGVQEDARSSPTRRSFPFLAERSMSEVSQMSRHHRARQSVRRGLAERKRAVSQLELATVEERRSRQSGFVLRVFFYVARILLHM